LNDEKKTIPIVQTMHLDPIGTFWGQF
jgi:hypothetical protein